jgi:hypothetical protein
MKNIFVALASFFVIFSVKNNTYAQSKARPIDLVGGMEGAAYLRPDLVKYHYRNITPDSSTPSTQKSLPVWGDVSAKIGVYGSKTWHTLSYGFVDKTIRAESFYAISLNGSTGNLNKYQCMFAGLILANSFNYSVFTGSIRMGLQGTHDWNLHQYYLQLGLANTLGGTFTAELGMNVTIFSSLAILRR